MSIFGLVFIDILSLYEIYLEFEFSLFGYSVYGRYQKIDGFFGDFSEEEVLVLYRLSGENFGMILGIDSDLVYQIVRFVYVKIVIIGGVVYRVTGSKKGI